MVHTDLQQQQQRSLEHGTRRSSCQETVCMPAMMRVSKLQDDVLSVLHMPRLRVAADTFSAAVMLTIVSYVES